MKITIEIGKYWHCLWNTASKDFTDEQPGRFVLLEGSKFKGKYIYFCERYLEAKAVQAILSKNKIKNCLLSDESSGDYSGFFVVKASKELKLNK